MVCVALLSPGDMGHGLAAVLVKNGVNVITCLAGRSERTKGLAEKAGIKLVEDDVTLVKEASMIWSVLVPARAGEIVDRIIAATKDLDKKPLFVDLNAISPETVKGFHVKLQENGIDLVDGGICGGPPKGDTNPRIYISGKRANEVQELSKFGLDIRILGDEIGTASGFKMIYAATNKGLTALGIQAFVAAKDLNVAEAFAKEMQASQLAMFTYMNRGLPSMCPKAYRWVGEMEEIAKTYEALGLKGKVFEGFAELFQLVTDSPLGKEIVEDRKLGTTLDFTVQAIVDYKNKK